MYVACCVCVCVCVCGRKHEILKESVYLCVCVERVRSHCPFHVHVPAAIRSWWEVPCVTHFSYLFRKPFKLPDFDIEVRHDMQCVLKCSLPFYLCACAWNEH